MKRRHWVYLLFLVFIVLLWISSGVIAQIYHKWWMPILVSHITSKAPNGNTLANGNGANQEEFGDMFGAVNALVSALAFFAVVVTFLEQFFYMREHNKKEIDLSLLEILNPYLTKYNEIESWFHSVIGGFARLRQWEKSHRLFVISLVFHFDSSNRPMRIDNKFIDDYVNCYHLWDGLGRVLFNNDYDLINGHELRIRFPTVEYVPHLVELLRLQKRFRAGVWTIAILYLRDDLEHRAPTWSNSKCYLEHLKLEVKNMRLLDYDIKGKESPIKIRDVSDVEHAAALKDFN